MKRLNTHLSPRRPCALVFAIALGLATAPVTQAAPASDPPDPSIIVVDASEGMITFRFNDRLTATALGEWLGKQLEDELTQAGIVPPGDPHEPWKITIDIQGFTHRYKYTLSAVRGDHVLIPPPTDPNVCTCTSEVLGKKIREDFRNAVETLREPPPPPQPEEAPTPEPQPELLEPQHTTGAPATVEPPPSPPETPRQRPRKFGGFGIAGAVLMPAGLVSIGFGAVGVAKGSEQRTGDQFVYTVQHDTAGRRTLLGLGIASVALGVAFVIIDQKVCRKKPTGCRHIAARDHAGRPAFRF